MIVSAPMNEQELRNLMFTASQPRKTTAFSIRYPRGQGVMTEWRTPFELVKIGKGRKLRDGDKLAILTIGHVGNYAVEAGQKLKKQGILIGHFDMRFVKPLDEELLHEVFSHYKKIVTIEDGAIQGGFGSAVLEFMADNNYAAEVRRLGIPDNVIEHGEQIELQMECGFDSEGIEDAVVKMLEPESVNAKA
jgi:1-deoxy-D-xylulose-5-phosphate synthase